MNDDYLWDKTGEPDPQIQQLEEILGTLRYQPAPLEIPEDLRRPLRRNYFAWMAIAASVLLALVAGGIWLSTRTRDEATPHQAEVITTPAPVPKESPSPSGTVNPKTTKRKVREEVVAVNRHRPKPSAPALSQREREEALLAKEQLMLALRVTTEKLSLVHKKTQNTNPANQIKNQHRVG